MASVDHPLTVKWVLFGFRGRIGRKSFILAALLLVLIQAALFAYVVSYSTPGQSPGHFTFSDSLAAIIGLAMMVSWAASAWALLALAVKRLHDLSLPAVLAICLIIPAISFLAWVALAVLPSKQETNAHGPVPFPKH